MAAEGRLGRAVQALELVVEVRIDAQAPAAVLLERMRARVLPVGRTVTEVCILISEDYQSGSTGDARVHWERDCDRRARAGGGVGLQ